MARRLNRRGKVAVGVLVLFVVVIVGYLLVGKVSCNDEVVVIDNEYLSPETNYIPQENNIRYSFNDLNDVHIASASSNGIPPIAKIDDFDSTQLIYPNQAELMRIQPCKYYLLGVLTHSEPYLVPIAKQLLDEIGERFYKKIELHGLNHVRFSVNSLLRTEEHQKQLSRRNTNAAKESAHVYGTTFDISYKGFIDENGELVQNYKLKRLLIEAIGELKDEGRCFVKSENKQACYHITVNQ